MDGGSIQVGSPLISTSYVNLILLLHLIFPLDVNLNTNEEELVLTIFIDKLISELNPWSLSITTKTTEVEIMMKLLNTIFIMSFTFWPGLNWIRYFRPSGSWVQNFENY